MTRKIKVNTDPVANQYTGPEERIVEVSSPGGGGLVSFRLREREDGTVYLSVQLYRWDAQVEITVAEQEG